MKKKLTAIIICLVFLLTSCGPRSDVTASENMLSPEKIISTESFSVYKFTDGDNICYVARGGSGTGIYCK